VSVAHSLFDAQAVPPGFGLWQVPLRHSFELHCTLSVHAEPFDFGA
jgi:hypothetical protein